MSVSEGLELELEQFARKVGLIVALEIGGKSSPDVAFQEIKTLYKKLKKFRKQALVQDAEENVFSPEGEDIRLKDPDSWGK